MGRKILLAERDPDFRYILNVVLEKAGYDVEPVNAADAIIEGRRVWPDLFILDKSLPEIDGLELCRHLKIQGETKNIPIIMISSYHHLRKKAEKLGVDDFIKKPFDLQVLMDAVNKHFRDQAGVAKSVGDISTWG